MIESLWHCIAYSSAAAAAAEKRREGEENGGTSSHPPLTISSLLFSPRQVESSRVGVNTVSAGVRW